MPTRRQGRPSLLSTTTISSAPTDAGAERAKQEAPAALLLTAYLGGLAETEPRRGHSAHWRWYFVLQVRGRSLFLFRPGSAENVFRSRRWGKHSCSDTRRTCGNTRAGLLEDEDVGEGENNAALQHQLDEISKAALVNSEVIEVSHKTILQELAEAKTTISCLTTSAARSVGWDSRLSAAMKEKDDMQQERDSESQRARLAESRFAALKERTSKLQNKVRRLQNALEEKCEHRLES
ncbi:PCI domain-containing protein [Mycena chlorophos]|uniref:PCI domain-containing protein n=1 Tax=Mycena chlorophos TaxID=658473 RepID=A0A8H6VQJ1_MYCCL|nr:PCI domain-containing protein [Mycena chlorophos]